MNSGEEVLFDCDAVLVGLVEGTVAALRYEGWEPAPHWDFLKNLPPHKKQEALAIWKSPGFIRNLPLVDGAREAIAEVRRVAPVRVVTAMEPEGQAERLLCLLENFRIEADAVTFALDKSGIPGITLVDDNPHHVEAWSRTQGRRAHLFSAPHNSGHPWPHRIRDWRSGLPQILGFLQLGRSRP